MFLKNRLLSIRAKFIIWYTLILAATFILFSIVLYFDFSSSLQRSLDSRLLSKAEGIMNSIDTYWETEKMEAIKAHVAANVFSKINNINFIKIAQRWVKEKSSDPELLNIIVKIYDPEGKIIAFSELSSDAIIFSKENLQSALEGNNTFENRNVAIGKGKATPFRLLAVPVFENNKIAYIVQVSSPLTLVDTALNKLKIILFLLLPLTVLVASIIAGEFLASVTLEPLNKMVKTVRQITSQNLKLRINIPDSKDEIKRLADTFNNMLEEIDRSFVSQRHFIHDISHELRTPLTIIKGELEVALKKARSQDEYSAVLRSNLEEVNKINRIVENLLMLIRYDSQELTLKPESLDLVGLVSDILGDMGLLAVRKGIKMRLLSQEPVVLEADKEKLRRLFLNLIDNAIKYSTEGGEVSLEIKKESDFVKISISDTGMGIPEEDLPFIFDRFYRIDKSRGSAGFGLGLCIAKSIVQAHRGKIEVKSQPDKGSTFIVSLPATLH